VTERQQARMASHHPVDPTLVWIRSACSVGFLALLAVDVIKTRRWQRERGNKPTKRR